jgi:hypothetical protein
LVRGATITEYVLDTAIALLATSVGTIRALSWLVPLIADLHWQVAVSETVLTLTHPDIALPLVRNVTLPSMLETAVNVMTCLEVTVLALPATLSVTEVEAL